jgi:ubiquinone/menaquinone biosynthesis C-methylase UbiE
VERAQSGWHFRLMALTHRFRDALLPRERILDEAGIRRGMTVLDYGCGAGSYVAPAAKLVGESGRIHALDIHPLAVRAVRKVVLKKRLTNVRIIRSDCDTGLSDDSVDVVLLYDVLHDLSAPTNVLRELHRVLKPDGMLSFSDHHLNDQQITTHLTRDGLFTSVRKGKWTYAFSPITEANIP